METKAEKEIVAEQISKGFRFINEEWLTGRKYLSMMEERMSVDTGLEIYRKFGTLPIKMRFMASTAIASMVILLSIMMMAGAIDNAEIRGHVATGDFTWDAQNFVGFLYDIDYDYGPETLTTTITEGNKLNEPNGIIYSTTAANTDFEYIPWGYYNVIAFQAKSHLAGYVNDPDFPDGEILYYASEDPNSLQDEQLERILLDNNDEMTLTSGTSLKLEEGYELSIKSIDIDGNKVYLELHKDGVMVDSKVIGPSTKNARVIDKNYYYKKDVGDSKDLVILAVHFKNAFRSADQNLVTIDGTWQISDVATEVEVDTEYDKMRIATVTGDTIIMDNKDNTISLGKNKDITLMGDMNILTSDQDIISEEDPLRYYIAKKISKPGIYRIRGSVAKGSHTWTSQTFAGFYYDIDDNLGTETLTTTITEGKNLNEPDGVLYSTTAQKTDFEFKPWGYYNVIGFLAKEYFAGYLNDPDFPDIAEILYFESEDENSLSDEQLESILVDNDDEMTVTSGTPLKLEEGYELSIKSIDIDGNKVYLELTKDGVMIDSKVISPSKDNALMSDKTYYL